MRKLETPNMMKVIPVPRATIARVESGAEERRRDRETLRKTGGAEGREAEAQEVRSFLEGKRELQTQDIARSGNGCQ